MFRHAMLFALLFAAGLLVAAGRRAEAAEDIDYAPYRSVLRTYVDEDGMVDYRALKANRGRLDAFVRALARLRPHVYRRWSDERKIAFWINAYNAEVLKTVIDNYPIEAGFFGSLRWPKNSIRQISGVFDDVEHRIMGRSMTLDDVEHETLREEFNEPRIHLALVCAAQSCPRLRREPYRGEKLDEQLDDQARDFVKHADNFRLDRREGVVHLSSIFKWFGEDFIKTYGTNARFRGQSRKVRAVLNYLSRFVPKGDRSYLERGDYDVEYLDYDWSLNDEERDD